MRRSRYLAAGLPALALAVGTAGCTTQTGELIVVVQTDMSLPKDIDSIRLEVRASGASKYDETYEDLGSNGGLLLPATMGILAPDDPATPVTIRVTARQGGPKPPQGKIRVLREATTTIPQDRIATFHFPVSFLCDGSGEDVDDVGNAQNSECAQGETCVAGACVPVSEGGKTDPSYEPGEVFGGGTGQNDGTCFDVTTCMEGGAIAVPAMNDSRCSIKADPSAGEVNVAILTEVDGICSDGCFVPLDANSETGWMHAEDAKDEIVLPPAVCGKLGGKVRALWTSPLKPGCPLKTVSTPTCGPWSSVGSSSAPDESKPMTRASGQHHPTSLALSGQDVFWASSGLFSADGAEQKTSGTVKRTEIALGALQSIDDKESLSARDIVVTDKEVYWTVANALEQGKGASIMQFTRGGTTPTSVVTAQNPEGIAITKGVLLWTEFTSGNIEMFNLGTMTKSTLVVGAVGKRPYRIVSDGIYTCWTNEGVGMMGDGSVECVNQLVPNTTATTIADNQRIPRAIALDSTGIYWATFDAQGGIYWAERDGTDAILASARLVDGQAYPNGLAVDDDYIYWTNWGDGTVWRLAKSAKTSAPQRIASGQRKPAEIAVGADHIVWVNEGSSVSSGMTSDSEVAGDGAVVTLKKPL
jgi:hypothetical protein